MKRVLLLAGGMLAIVGALGCATSMALQGAFEDPVQRELRWQTARAAADRAAAQDAAVAPYVTLAATLFWLAVAVVIAVGVLLLALAAGSKLLMWIDAYRLTRAQARLVWAEEGMYPVPAAALLSGRAADVPRAALAGYWQARIAEAANVGTPEHYAPSVSYEYENRQETPAGQVPPQLAPPVFVPPSIGEAAERGAFRDGRYILGYAVAGGAPVTLDQESGRSLLIAGQGGSGGTTALLAAALQEILMPFYLPGQQEPARFIVVDYHARKPQGLLQRIGGELGDRVLLAAHQPEDVAAAVRLFEAEGRARVDGAPTPYPLILLCDEVGNMIDDEDYAEVIPGLLGAFKHANNAYRAIGGKAIVRGHTLQASAWGNTATIRGSFHARSGMRLDEGAGVLLGLKPAIARTLLALPAGQSYVTGPGLAPTHVVSSNVRRQDMSTVIDLAGYRAKARTVHPVAPAAPEAPPMEDRGRVLTGDWWNHLATEAEVAADVADLANLAAGEIPPPPRLTPMQKRALAMWRLHRTPGEIVAGLFTYTPRKGPNAGQEVPVTSDAGAIYQARLQEVYDLIWSAEDLERGHPAAEGRPA